MMDMLCLSSERNAADSPLIKRLLALEKELESMKLKSTRLETEYSSIHHHVLELEKSQRDDRISIRALLSCLSKAGLYPDKDGHSDGRPGRQVRFHPDSRVTFSADTQDNEVGGHGKKQRVPTSFTRGPPPEEDEVEGAEYCQNHVRFSEDTVDAGRNDASGKKKKRVPTTFARESPPEQDDDGDDSQRHVKFQTDTLEGTGSRDTAKKYRVPTSFPKDDTPWVDDDAGCRQVRFDKNTLERAGDGDRKKMRVPTSFPKGSLLAEEHDDGPQVRFNEEALEQAGVVISGKKLRVPTSFPRSSTPVDDDVGGSRQVRFDDNTSARTDDGNSAKALRVPTSFSKGPLSSEGDDEDDARKVRFEEETLEHVDDGNTAKKLRVPTSFSKGAPLAEDDDENAVRQVRFDDDTSEPGGHGNSAKKLRVPTSFPKDSSLMDDDDGGRQLRFDEQALEQAGDGNSAKKLRVPTSFSKGPLFAEDDDNDNEGAVRQVRFDEDMSERSGDGKTAKTLRVPTSFAKGPSLAEDDDDGQQVRFDEKALEQAGDGKTMKTLRVPTSFAKGPPLAEGDGDDNEDGGRQVRFSDDTSERPGDDKTAKTLRVPTSFAKGPSLVEDDDDGRQVRFDEEALEQGGDGKTLKTLRVPTSFSKGPPLAEGDGDGNEDGSRQVRFDDDTSGRAGDGNTAKTLRVPTSFAKGPSLVEDDDDGRQVRFDEQALEQGGDGKTMKTLRVPTSFSKGPPLAEGDSDDNEDVGRQVRFSDDTSERPGDGNSAKKVRVPTSFSKGHRLAEEVDGDDSRRVSFDEDASVQTGDATRAKKARVPTSFKRDAPASEDGESDDDEDDDDDDGPAVASTATLREYREKSPKVSEDEGVIRRRPSAVTFGESPAESPERIAGAVAFEAASFRVDEAPDDKDIGLILEAMSVGFFHDLSEDARGLIASEMEAFQLPDACMVAEEGRLDASHFFIIASGSLEVTRDGNFVIELQRGALVGESVLLLHSAQNANVITKGPAKVYAMEGARARRVLQRQYQDDRKEATAAVNLALHSSSTCGLLHNLTTYEEGILYDEATTQHFPAGHTLENAEGDDQAIHVLLSGNLEISDLDGGKAREIRRFGLVGDLAVLYGSVLCNAYAREPTQTLVLTKAVLKKTLGDRLEKKLLHGRICDHLLQLEVFSTFSMEKLDALAAICEVIEIKPGEEVVRPKTTFALALVGNVDARFDDASVRSLRGMAGDALGQDKLMGTLSSCTFVAKNTGSGVARVAVWTTKLTRALQALKSSSAAVTECPRSNSMQLAVLDSDKAGALKKVFYLQTLSAEHLQMLALAIEVEYFAAGETIVRQGDEGNCFFIIHSGLLEVSIDERKIRNMGIGDYFGERALLFSEPRSATAVACEDTELWRISAEAFLAVVEGPILDYMKDRITFQDTRLSLDSLECTRIVGRGGFGVVKMVRNKEKNARYALKCVNIQHAIDNRQQQNLCAERAILAELDHPFIIKYIRTFKSVQHVYFLMELVTGGELLDVLQHLGLLSRTQAQFYVGSIVLALEFLHERRIAYLDLKGENCLIDSHGYMKIVDFGIAERVVNGKIFVTRGTCYYMAPEVILPVNGYSTTADLWSLGVVTFDFMTGRYPFANEITDPWRQESHCQILSEILKGSKMPLKFPRAGTHKLDTPARNFCAQLLRASPAKRLGAGLRGGEEIRSHEFFGGFSWEGLLARQLQPPFVPKGEVYAEGEDANPAELAVVEDAADENGVIKEPDDPDPSWLSEF